jgi:hypothetical protein
MYINFTYLKLLLKQMFTRKTNRDKLVKDLQKQDTITVKGE